MPTPLRHATATVAPTVGRHSNLVLSTRGGITTIGVQRPSADPDSEIAGIVGEVPGVVERASWEETPRYPDYVRPATSTGRRSRRGQGTAGDTTAEGEAAQQQPQTLRLF